MPTFVGRNRELALAREGLRQSGHVVLLHGPGGIGKTRLLREALQGLRTERTPATTLYGRANQMDAELAFAPLIDALTGYLDGLTPAGQHEALADLDVLADLLDGYGLPPPQDRAQSEPRLHRTRRLDAIRRLVSRVDGTPVLLVIDDAHWADDGTLGALAHLSRLLGDGPLTIGLTFRDAEASPALRATLATLRRAGPVIDLALQPLTDDAVESILTAELGARPTQALLRMVVDRTAGNSLYVTSLARHLRDAGLVGQRVDGAAQLLPGAEPGVPAEVEDMLALRQDTVSPLAQDVLGALGVADGPVAAQVIATVTGHQLEGVEDAVDELVRSGLAVESGRAGHIAAAHPLVAEAAYRTLGDRRRRRLHAEFVTAMEADPTAGPPGRLARHYRLAGAKVDPARAIDVLTEAADRARDRYAPREALLHAQAAVDVARQSGARPLPPLLHRLGVIWVNLGEAGTGEALLRSSLAMVDHRREPQLAAAVLADLATLHYYKGEPQRSLACLQEATRIDPIGAAAAHVPWRRAHVAFTFGLPDELQAVAAGLPDRTDDPLTLVVRAMAAQDRGDFDEAAQNAQRAVELLDVDPSNPGPFGMSMRARSVLVQVASFRGTAAGVQQHIDALERHAELVQSPAARWRTMVAQMLLAHMQGADDTVDRHRAHLQMLQRHEPRRTHVNGWIDLLFDAWRGDVDRITAQGQELLELQGEDLDSWGRTCNDLLAIAAARRGGSDDRVDLDAPAQTHSMMPPLNLSARALVALRRGDDDVEEAVQRLRRMGGPGTIPDVWAGLVELHRTTDVPATLRLGTDLAGRCAAGGWPRLEAWVARAAAERIAIEDPAQAVDLASRAMDLAGPLGEGVDADAAAAVLRLAGVRRRVSRASEGDLTARQREIAALVAAGLSSADIAARLYISVRTVTTHLDHVYQRLGISSRHELAARVRDGQVT